MPCDLHSESPGPAPGPRDTTGRVSRGRTQVPLLSRRSRLIAIMLAGFPALIWWDSSPPPPASADRLSLAGHTLLVQAVAFSPDGRTLASCGNDRTVRLWDTTRWGEGGPASPDILAHRTPVVAMAFSPDGRSLVTAAAGTLTIWPRDPSAGRVLERDGASFRGVAFSPDGRTLALGGEDGTIRLWEMPSARERAVLRDSDAPVNSVAFSPDGTVVASGDHEGRVILRDAATGARRRVLREGSFLPIRTVAFSPDGRSLGVAEPAGAGDALFYDVETGAIRGRLPGRPLGFVALALSPDGRTAATAGIDHAIRIWDLARSAERAAFAEGRVLKSVAFSPDGRWLACSSGEGVRLVDLTRPPAGASTSPRSESSHPGDESPKLHGVRPKNG